jgi:hypothetical protein
MVVPSWRNAKVESLPGNPGPSQARCPQQRSSVPVDTVAPAISERQGFRRIIIHIVMARVSFNALQADFYGL